MVELKDLLIVLSMHWKKDVEIYVNIESITPVKSPLNDRHIGYVFIVEEPDINHPGSFFELQLFVPTKNITIPDTYWGAIHGILD